MKKLKEYLYFIFITSTPIGQIYNMFRYKESRKQMLDDFKHFGNVVLDNLYWTFALYSFTLIIPLGAIIFMILYGILGMEMMGEPFSLNMIGDFMAKYFYNGHLPYMGDIVVEMWRVHIVLLIFAFTFHKIAQDDNC